MDIRPLFLRLTELIKHRIYGWCSLFFTFAFVALTAVTSANHSWNGYHVLVKAIPSPYRVTTSQGRGMQFSIQRRRIGANPLKPRTCRPTSGRVEVCTDTYGNNAWLGIAQVWISGRHTYYAGCGELNSRISTHLLITPPLGGIWCPARQWGDTLGMDHQEEFEQCELGHVHGLHEQPVDKPASEQT